MVVADANRCAYPADGAAKQVRFPPVSSAGPMSPNSQSEKTVLLCSRGTQRATVWLGGDAGRHCHDGRYPYDSSGLFIVYVRVEAELGRA